MYDYTDGLVNQFRLIMVFILKATDQQALMLMLFQTASNAIDQMVSMDADMQDKLSSICSTNTR